ncbi:protein of unknown function [Hyphomicrobium sp. 1Nfss2.1]
MTDADATANFETQLRRNGRNTYSTQLTDCWALYSLERNATHCGGIETSTRTRPRCSANEEQ